MNCRAKFQTIPICFWLMLALAQSFFSSVDAMKKKPETATKETNSALAEGDDPSKTDQEKFLTEFAPNVLKKIVKNRPQTSGDKIDIHQALHRMLGLLDAYNRVHPHTDFFPLLDRENRNKFCNYLIGTSRDYENPGSNKYPFSIIQKKLAPIMLSLYISIIDDLKISYQSVGSLSPKLKKLISQNRKISLHSPVTLEKTKDLKFASSNILNRLTKERLDLLTTLYETYEAFGFQSCPAKLTLRIHGSDEKISFNKLLFNANATVFYTLFQSYVRKLLIKKGSRENEHLLENINKEYQKIKWFGDIKKCEFLRFEWREKFEQAIRAWIAKKLNIKN